MTFPYRITVCDSTAQLVQKIIDFLEVRLRERVSGKHVKPFGLATGRTMEPIYSALVERLKSWPNNDLNKLLDDWISFNLDEYLGLKDGDSRSFRSYMERTIGVPLDLNSSKLRIPYGQAQDPHKEASSYLDDLLSFGGLSFQLLGLGLNGHIGFNEPPSGPEDSCRVVTLSSATFKQNAFSFGGDQDIVPRKAITLGMKEILAAEEVHLIVIGKEKSSILYELFCSKCSDQIPASWLRNHQKVFLWADSAAYEKVQVFINH